MRGGGARQMLLRKRATRIWVLVQLSAVSVKDRQQPTRWWASWGPAGVRTSSGMVPSGPSGTLSVQFRGRPVRGIGSWVVWNGVEHTRFPRGSPISAVSCWLETVKCVNVSVYVSNVCESGEEPTKILESIERCFQMLQSDFTALRQVGGEVCTDTYWSNTRTAKALVSPGVGGIGQFLGPVGP